MAYEEIIKNSKEYVLIIITGFSGIITNLLHRIVTKKEKMDTKEFFSLMYMSLFVGLMVGIFGVIIGVGNLKLAFIEGIAGFWATKIIEAIDMITAKSIYNLFIDYIKYKVGKRK